MTEDARPLRSLFSDRNPSADEVGGEERSRQARSRLTPLKVVAEARRLPASLRRVLLTVFRRGGASRAELAGHLDMPEAKVSGCLGELELQGYVDVEDREGEPRYTIASAWGEEEFPAGPIIPLIYQYNLLSDRNRLDALAEAIDMTVEEGDVVADLGSGAGVLSYLAAEKASKVYAVEVDREVYQKGREILVRAGLEDVVEPLCRDARNVELPEPVDVVLCEMLDTGLIAELQVPVMNYAVDELLGTEGVVVPYEARTTLALVRSDYRFHGAEFGLPHFEAYGSRPSEVLSNEYECHSIVFDRQNELDVERRLHIEATEPGPVNGLQLRTYVRFASDQEWTGPSAWLNAPLTLPLDENRPIQPGSSLEVWIRYELGGGLSDIDYAVTGANARQ